MGVFHFGWTSGFSRKIPAEAGRPPLPSNPFEMLPVPVTGTPHAANNRLKCNVLAYDALGDEGREPQDTQPRTAVPP